MTKMDENIHYGCLLRPLLTRQGTSSQYQQILRRQCYLMLTGWSGKELQRRRRQFDSYIRGLCSCDNILWNTISWAWERWLAAWGDRQKEPKREKICIFQRKQGNSEQSVGYSQWIQQILSWKSSALAKVLQITSQSRTQLSSSVKFLKFNSLTS